MDFASFSNDERTWRAVLQCIEVIGETARHTSEATRQAIPEVPWRQIVGTRHRLAHVYFDIDLKLVWEVVAGDLVPMLESLRRWEQGQTNRGF